MNIQWIPSLLLAASLCTAAPRAGNSSGLEQGFIHPPASARPWVYWFWLDGNITREGITADLEAMKRVGIGGVLIMEVDQGAPKGPARFAGTLWREMFKFVLSEANRLGLEVNMNNDAGWCGSGGPWITPEVAQKKIVWTETNLTGGKKFVGLLPQPQAVADWYRDIVVLAIPTPAGDDVRMTDYTPGITASMMDSSFDGKKLVDGDAGTRITLPLPEKDKPQFIQISFAKPFLARVLTLSLSGTPDAGCHGALQVSDDGEQFRTVREFDAYPPALELNFDGISTRWFRILFTHTDPEMKKLAIGEVGLSPRYRIHNIQDKAAFTPNHVPLIAGWPDLPADLTTPRDRVTDLTGRMDKDGRLLWDAPQGKWTVLRIGYTPTGIENHPAPLEGLGPECDKLDKAGADAMFAGLMAKIISDSKPFVPKTLVSTHIDSWEVGSQNWTKNFRQEFRKRRGYDLLTFLPVMTGRVVGSLEISERFLWDLRQTVSDLLVENYAGRFKELAHKHGMRLSIEAYDGCPADEMTYAGQADEPMAEFWSWPKFMVAWSGTEMSSAAHVYGKRILGAEAFTATDAEKWQGYPALIKDLGDWAFCEGINRFVFHRYALQPWADRPPGMSMGPWGLHYERTETWWEQSSAWHEYLSRCQYLLQQGLFVADICCLEPEGSPMRFIPPASVRPAGVERGRYSFDGCTREVVMTRMKVKNGRLILPDGMSYRLLVLPEVETMTPQLLRRIKDLVAAGAIVVGAPPVKSPGLTGYPHCDKELRQISDSLWGDCDGKKVTEHRFGKGRVVWGKAPADVLTGMGVGPDFSFSAADGVSLRYIHRSIGGSEIYFVSNKNRSDGMAVCSFRVKGRRPQLWWPDAGLIEKPAVYDEVGECVNLPIHFDPAGSVFVVFAPDAKAEPDRITSVKRNGEELLNTTVAETEKKETSDNNEKIIGTFTMAVWAKPGMNIGLPKEANDGVFLDVVRNDALYPPPGHEVYPPDENHSGAGLSIGKNGVCVYEHSASYFAPLLVYASPIVGWKHVTVVYKDGEPSLYLDGKFVHKGLKSTYKVHPGVGVQHSRGMDMFNGEIGEFRLFDHELTEMEIMNLTKAMPLPPPRLQGATVTIVRGESGVPSALVSQPGKYDLKSADGKSSQIEVSAMPQPFEIPGPWELTFSPNLGAPAHLTMEKLISWTEYPEPGVNHYSGAATYTKTLDVPAELRGGNRVLFLDLGRVEVMAQVKLNDKDLGILWKPPYSVDVTNTVKSGSNTLEVKVVNLWINRQIGDEQLQEDSDRNPDGTLKAWPQWVGEGKSSPTGRISFTSWRLWKKDDPLVESGLLGPVTLQSREIVKLK